MKKKYPYLNKSLVDIPGEQWDDIPGLDGYFRVSNYGRMKGCFVPELYQILNATAYLRRPATLRTFP